MKKRTITISLRNWEKLARMKLQRALLSYDAVLDILFLELDDGRSPNQDPEPIGTSK